MQGYSDRIPTSIRVDGTYKDGFVVLMQTGQEREAMAVMSVQIAPEIVNDKVYR